MLRLFPKDSDEVIDYQGERTVAGLSKFIDSNGKEAGKAPEEVYFLRNFKFLLLFLSFRRLKKPKKLKRNQNQLMKIYNLS